MENLHITDKRKVKLEEINAPGYIPFMGGRPDRERVIKNDDIIDLEILLNTTKSVDELLLTL
jgi:hypothetical protein